MVAPGSHDANLWDANHCEFGIEYIYYIIEVA